MDPDVATRTPDRKRPRIASVAVDVAEKSGEIAEGREEEEEEEEEIYTNTAAGDIEANGNGLGGEEDGIWTTGLTMRTYGSIGVWIGRDQQPTRHRRSQAGKHAFVSVHAPTLKETNHLLDKFFPDCGDVQQLKDNIGNTETTFQRYLQGAIRSWIQDFPGESEEWEGHLQLQVRYEMKWIRPVG